MMTKNNLSIDSTLNIDVNSLEVPYIAWEVEEECNMYCQFCYSSSWNQVQRNEPIPPDPPLDTIIKGLELLQKSNLHIKYINWTGGEPLFRHKKSEDLVDIIKESYNRGFKNVLSTNCMFTPIFKNDPQKEFTKLLDELNDYLEFISISWDADNEECNDNVMRINGGHHYKDVQAFLEIYKRERYTFKLKVNTLVTKQNKESVSGIFEYLKDIPCIWKIVQFNPRECKEVYRRKYEISRLEFFELFNEIKSGNYALHKASKCTIINRLYGGEKEPYCFLVINTKGEVLLPKGEAHIPLANIFEEEWKPNSFKKQVSKGIHKELIDAQVYKKDSSLIAVGNISDWGALLSEIQGNTKNLTTKLLTSKLIEANQLENIKAINVSQLTDELKEGIVAAFNAIKDNLTFYKDEIAGNGIELSLGVLKELNNLNVILKKSGDLNKEDCNLQDSQKVDIKWFNVSILMQLFPQILSRKPPLEVFSEINKNILYRSYLHHKFNEDEAKRKLNKLLSIERGFLCEVFGWYSDEFYEIGINNEKEKQSCNNLRRNIKYNDNRPPSYNRMKFLLEQEKVGKFLSQDWGVVGGTIAVLNYRNGKGSSPRLAPCVERAPEGIHFPWCFDSFNTKRKFLKKLFAGGISNTKVDLGMTDNDIVNTFIVQRELPKSILDIAIDITIDFNYTPVDTILEVIKGYLNNSLFHTYDREDWVKCSYILTICVELIVRKLASAFKDEGIDSVHEIFYDEEKEMKYLSELERKLGVFMVPAEESISVACEWIKKMSSNNKLNLESVNQKWIRLAEHKRIRDWREYQNKEVRKKLQFNDPAVGPRCDAVKQRFSPVFWLYLFDPFIEDSQSINIPHVMFVKMQKLQLKTSENLTEDTLSSFAAVYFNDEIFQRFWNRREQIWCNGSNDVNEMNLKAYVHHLQNFVYPVASYNVNLELNEEREKLAREREAKKFLEREINKERMFNHIYIPVFTGMESILSKIRNKEKVEIDYIGILKNQVNALFLISSIRQRMKDFDLKKYVNFLDKTKTKLVPLSIILENILYIALFSRVIQVDIADYLTKKGFEISKEFNLVNLRNVLFSRRNFLRNDLFPKMNFEISNNIKLLVPTNDDSDTGDYCGFLLIVFMGIIDNFLKHPFLGNWYLRIKYIEEKNRSGNIILSYYPTGYQYGESEDFKLFTDVTNDGLGLQVFNDFLTNFDCSLYLRKGIGRVKRSNYKMYEQKIQFNNECNKLLRVTNGMDML